MGWRLAVATRLTFITPPPLPPSSPLLFSLCGPDRWSWWARPAGVWSPPPDALSAFCSIYIRLARQSDIYNPGLLNGALGSCLMGS